MSILPQHAKVVTELVKHLQLSVAEVLRRPELCSQGSTGVYGMVANIPDKAIIDDFIVQFFSELYTPELRADKSIMAMSASGTGQ